MTEPASHRHWLKRMRPRDPHEPHRVATPLELLYDLCFVVAVAQVSERLHHALAEHHAPAGVAAYAMVFFAIWWAWMNFTWFASAYDTDDVPYRLKVFVQIAGVLTLAAGVPRAFDHGDFSITVVGYVIMRVPLIFHWLRAAATDPPRRTTARRYALGLTLGQVGWIAAAYLPFEGWLAASAVLVPLELLVPMWAERSAPTSWHPHHIVERYGLLTLIVLGESVLSATVAIQSAITASEVGAPLIALIAGALVSLFAMWWIYFDVSPHGVLRSNREAFVWGYGHLIVFASTAAFGAGLAYLAEHPDAHGLSAGIPLALFVASVWLVHIRPLRCGARWATAYLLTAALVLAASFLPFALAFMGAAMAVLVTWSTLTSGHPRESPRELSRETSHASSHSHASPESQPH